MAEGWNKTKEEGSDVTVSKKRTRHFKKEQFGKYQILRRASVSFLRHRIENV
jgi:hypothetical protein